MSDDVTILHFIRCFMFDWEIWKMTIKCPFKLLRWIYSRATKEVFLCLSKSLHITGEIYTGPNAQNPILYNVPMIWFSIFWFHPTDQPRFITTHQQRTIYAWPGQQHPISITCAVDSLPPPVVRWHHRHQRILTDGVAVAGGRTRGKSVYHVYAVNNYTSVLQVCC
jgi:hypothetical protein